METALIRQRMHPLATPDGRYIVVRERLWRSTNPALTAVEKDQLTHDLMDARRAKKPGLKAGDAAACESARRAVDAAKIGLGERGPVWWADGSPDFNRYLVKNTPYRDWFLAASLPSSDSA